MLRFVKEFSSRGNSGKIGPDLGIAEVMPDTACTLDTCGKEYR